MKRLPCVLLRHETRRGSHYDWLIGCPSQYRSVAHPGRLWAARCPWPSTHWASAGVWPLLAIAPHRAAYLTHQGPIGGDRGVVRRVDQGWVRPWQWAGDRLVIRVSMGLFDHDVRIDRVAADHWRASLV